MSTRRLGRTLLPDTNLRYQEGLDWRKGCSDQAIQRWCRLSLTTRRGLPGFMERKASLGKILVAKFGWLLLKMLKFFV